jgi:hypothetical protein
VRAGRTPDVLCPIIQAGYADGAGPAARSASRRAADELCRDEVALVKYLIGRWRKPLTYETVSAGQIGVFEAARRWDPSRSKWSGYASLWIFKYVMLELQHDTSREQLTPDGELRGDVGDARDDLDRVLERYSRGARASRLYDALASWPRSWLSDASNRSLTGRPIWWCRCSEARGAGRPTPVHHSTASLRRPQPPPA